MRKKNIVFLLIILLLSMLLLPAAACGTKALPEAGEKSAHGSDGAESADETAGAGSVDETAGAESTDGPAGAESAHGPDGTEESGAMGETGEEEGNQTANGAGAFKEEDGSGKEKASGAEKEINLEVNDACDTILYGCTREFIGAYLVDDAFLAWVAAEFGADTIFALAEAVESGTQDQELWYQLTGNSIHVLWNMYCRTTGYQHYYLERVYWKDCADPEKIVLDFIGDINFDENWSTMKYLDKQVDGLYNCISPELLEELNQADIMMVNNEFTYSRRGEPVPGKDYTFRADPDRVYLLEIMGTDIVSLANNHAYDYGKDALLDTMATLEEAGIPYVGAGEDLREAMKPSYFIVNGRKIAIVAATQIERSLNYTKEATETEPGVLKTLQPDKFVKVIEEARAFADYVIAYVHWGTEQNSHFEQDQTRLADAFIEAGVDAIIGGHTHCLQGCEYRNGVPIIYSLGNFWFNSNKLDTGISQLVIHRNGDMDFRFLPCVQKKNQTYLAEEEGEKQRILEKMESLSVGVTFDEDGYIIESE